MSYQIEKSLEHASYFQSLLLDAWWEKSKVMIAFLSSFKTLSELPHAVHVMIEKEQ